MSYEIAPDELAPLAAELGMKLTDEEVETFSILAGPLTEVMAVAPTLPDGLEPPVDARREVVDGPSDPFNAVVRWCDVQADTDAGALAGMRIAVKDCIAIAGIPMTGGSALLEGFVPSVDSTVTRRVLDAGARIVAVTNMDEFAMSAGGDSSVYGPTLCPVDPTRTVGGSSSGSAAILHYGVADASLGTDTGGSIRVPASWSGVLGMKPTHGLVPYTGVMAIDQRFDHVGAMALSTEDLARLIQVVAGVDGLDPRQPDRIPELHFTGAVAAAPSNLTGVRLGLLAEGFSAEAGVDPEVAAAVRSVVAEFEHLGAEVVEVSVPEHAAASPVMFSMLTEGFLSLLEAGGNGYQWEGEYWPELADALRTGYAAHADRLSPQLKLALTLGSHLRREYGGGAYARASNVRRWIRAGYSRVLAECDFVLMPTVPGLPHESSSDLPLTDRIMRSWGTLGNTSATDITGHPAISLPVAEASGLPVGMMTVGKHFADHRLLGFAASIEQTIGWKCGP